MDDHDLRVRRATYARLVDLGRAPTAAEVAAATGASVDDVIAAWHRLHAVRALVLSPDPPIGVTAGRPAGPPGRGASGASGLVARSTRSHHGAHRPGGDPPARAGGSEPGGKRPGATGRTNPPARSGGSGPSPATDEIRMANPFSAVPTSYRVRAAGRWWYANCAWDAIGICAALHVDGEIHSSCPDCGEPVELAIHDERPDDESLLFHCLVPAAHWWDDIFFT